MSDINNNKRIAKNTMMLYIPYLYLESQNNQK